MGYSRAGFTEIVGVDIKPQKRYPFTFVLGDALEYVAAHGREFDAIHASPPCQGYSIMRNLPWLKDREYPMLIPSVRAALDVTGTAWVIENVEGARRSDKHPDGLRGIYLCGSQFGLPIFRHRRFESSCLLLAPPHSAHGDVISGGPMLGNRAALPVRKTGHRYGFDRPGNAVGHGNMAGISAKIALDVPWMDRDGASQAIPPAYTEFIGKQLIQAIPRPRPTATELSDGIPIGSPTVAGHRSLQEVKHA